MLTCSPSWTLPTIGTPRSPDRPTTGGRVAARAAAFLGVRLDPYQRHICDVAGEHLEDGRPAYPTVILHLGRQQGKSLLTLAVLLERILRPGATAGYMAQTGFDARNKLLDDWAPLLDRRWFHVRRSNGNTAVLVAELGSALRVLSSSQTAGRGQSLDLVVFDELMSHRDRSVWSAVSATTITRPDAQLWGVSNAGSDQSVLLADMLLLGREYVEQGRRDGVALFDWHAQPDDDPADPATWRTALPAMHTGRVAEHTIAARYAEDRSPDHRDFRREYLNTWSSDIADAVLPAQSWSRAADPDAAPADPLTFAVEVAFVDQAAAIVAADPRGHVEVVEHRPGVDWLAGRLAELVARHQPVAVVGDLTGPLLAHLPALSSAGVDIAGVDTAGRYEAPAVLRGKVIAGELHIRPHPALEVAARQARRRHVGDRWVLDRRDGGDASPLVAAALAVHHAATAATPAIY